MPDATEPMNDARIRIANGREIPLSFGGLRLARRKSLVRIREPQQAELLKTAWGVLAAKPGEDLIVIDKSGSEAPIKKEIFERTYGEAAHGEFRKHGVVRLVQVPIGVTAILQTLEGDLEVGYPDYVVVGTQGEVYPNDAGWVAENLEFLV